MSRDSATEFAKLWTRVQPNVFAYVSATIRSFQDAEDVLQNVAVTAIRKFAQYDPDRPFVPWIIGIARIEVLKYLRARGNDQHELVDEDLLVALAGACERTFPELDLQRAALAQCLPKLKGRMREVVERRYGQGMKTGMIAEAMDLAPGYVSVVLNRAYRHLRECIDRQATLKGAV
jgi:RNA polymerase sigma-70 factor, ECF subfamily